ncbi:MAG: DUF58 domain-containing protein [Eubacteriales bacterium]|nr:DUF58 domain-containing protein [Eubacteriales bacterium]
MIVVWVILGALFLWKIQSVWYAKSWDKGLSVTLSFSRKSAVQGEECELRETVENRKLLPLPALKVKFQVSRELAFEDSGRESSVTDQYYRNDVFSIRPYMRHTRSLPFVCRRRGFYRINGLDLVAGDLFFTRELVRSLSSREQLYVYPKPWTGLDFTRAMQRLSGEVLSRRHLQEDPFEYQGIREYTPRDTLRDVNWKATARSGELKVNRKGYTAQRAVRLILNLEDGALLRQEALLEASISMAAAAAQVLLGQGVRVALFSNGPDLLTGEPVCLEAASGAGHMESVNRGLARVDLQKPAPAFEGLARRLEETAEDSLMTVFFSADARDDVQDLLERLLEKKRDFVWFCPTGPLVKTKIRPRLAAFAVPVFVEER